MVPPSRWCGVRACELRNSPFGLLSERTTCFSYGDAICTGGKVEPNCKLHSGSLSGSAAAPVMFPAVLIAPAIAIPCPSSTRRLIKPLPATGSCGGVRPTRFEFIMMSSRMRDVLCILLFPIGQYAELRCSRCPVDKAVARSIRITASNVIGAAGPFPLWVISRHMQCKKPCPLYTQERTCAAQRAMSALGQKQTLHYLLNYFVGTGKKRRWDVEPERF